MKEARKGPNVQEWDMTTAILEYLLDNGPTMTTGIQRSFGINSGRISKKLKEMESKNILEMKRTGGYEARTYSLTRKGVLLLGLLRVVHSIDPPERDTPFPKEKVIDTSSPDFVHLESLIMKLCELDNDPSENNSNGCAMFISDTE